ncbi:Kinesin-like protein KIF26B [Oryzias melastigma]|uniref:Kinesin-like protein KIF26B n=1 Tax=Oryzias melastigma TaxID=30732 RepID=A0A834KZW1_ORYME|nr:Kinesin-like protein KIF26B [Oryzias melastigma]
MSSVTGRGESFPASIRTVLRNSEAREPVGFTGGGCRAKERPTPEGAGGSKGDANMCQRTEDAPSSRCLQVPERFRMPFSGGGTLRRAHHFGGSERKVAGCEKCSATLVGLKKQALSLAVHHRFSCKETSPLATFLHANLRVHGRASTESWDRDREQGQCGACGANTNLLKQEAIHLALSRSQPSAKPYHEAGLSSSGTTLGQSETKLGDGASKEPLHQQWSRTHSPQSLQRPKTPQGTPQTLRRLGAKLPNPDMERWVEEQQQLLASKSTDGVMSNSCHKAADDSALSSGNAVILQTNSRIQNISRVVTIANTAAMSFLARAAEKLNLTLRKKNQASDPAPSHASTCFREIIQKNPPPVPTCLLQAAARTKDSPDVGKVKVMLRVSRMLSDGQFQPPVLRIDPSRKRVIVIEPPSKNLTHSTMTLGRENRNPLKTFSFDAAYSQDSSQAELCTGVLTDVIRCVLSGSDGCVLGLGCADVGSWSSMVGSGENIQKLGLIPCAISWLYGAIERRREKTWTEMTVSVSAIELCCGEEDTLRDLLGEVVPSSGSTQDSPKAHVRVQEDPVSGIQIRNHNRVKAPTAERAASLLDAAIAARRHADFITYLCHSSIMFFTLYVQPPRTESSTIGKGSRGTAKLTMIDVCSGMRGVNRNKLPHAELGPIVVSLLNGHKTLPNKSSKLNMLLRESLAHANCHTAVIAQVADSLAHHQETFSTIQMASRIRRTQKRTKQSTSCSPCGRSLTKEHKVPRSTLRAFHSTDEVDVDIRPLRLRGDLDRSSSDHSCDTVIQIDSDGSFRSKGVPTPAQPEFVPIIPSLHPNKTDLDDPEFTALLQELLRIPQLHGVKRAEDRDFETLKGERKQPERECLKCDTFAELQKRLGCIDGSEISIDALKSSLKAAACNVLPESVHPKETSTAPQSSSNHGAGGGQNSQEAKQTDGALSGENFPREDSGLYDCEECSGTSSSEELLNQTLGMNCIGAVRTSNDLSLQESNTQGKSATTPSILQSTEKPPGHEAADWFKPDKRASPVGKCSSISPSSSCFSSNSLTKGVILGDVLPNPTPDESKAMKATITVTVQQPLDLKGQDELVFSMVEEVTINGAYGRGKTAGNVFCIRDPALSRAENTSSTSQPIRIISDVSEDSAAAGSSDSQLPATDANNEKPIFFRREKGTLPSFLNPMLMETDLDNLEAVKDKIIPNKRSETLQLKSDSHSNHDDKSHRTASPEKLPNNKEKEDKDFYNLESKMCEKRLKNADGSHGSDCKHLHSPNNEKVSKEGGIAHRHTGNIPKIAAFSPGCQETLIGSSVTSSLPRDWPGANPPSNHSRGVTSSTPCSPGETLERGKGRKRPPANQSVHGSCSPKHGSRKGHAKPKSSSQDSSRLFNTKLELLASRNNSLGRDFPALERRSSSKESVEAGYRGHLEGDCTFPRARKDPHPDQSYHFFPYESQSAKHAHSKLSAVGKPKTASPKVRRLSSPSIKNLSQSQKNLHETVNRSASLSPEIKTVSFERTSSFFSSSPPRSHRSVSRTPSQSSTCSSSKSVIQGFVNGRISDLLRDRAPSPISAGLGHMTPIPSPYSQVTAPRSPDHLSGHASDTTSVLSGDMPPAMGKTLLHFSNRSSFVSSGYGSMVRDSEATGSSTSTRDSTSDRSSSLPGGARSSRSSRRRGNPGTHQRHPLNDTPQAVKSSSSGVWSRWTERGIPEAYDIKVYEIDDVQRMHKRTGSRMLQRQTEVFGTSSAEDLRAPKEIQPPEERAGTGQTQSHAGGYQMEPRVRPVTNFRGALHGAPGGP